MKSWRVFCAPPRAVVVVQAVEVRGDGGGSRLKGPHYVQTDGRDSDGAS